MPIRTISQSISLQKQPDSDVNKYITEITNNGITVHPEGQENTNYLHIANNMEIVRNGISVAEYGENIRIGKEDSTKVIIAEGSILPYTTAGAYIVEKVNNVDTVLAQFTANSVQIGRDENQESRIITDVNGMHIYFKNNNIDTELASFSSNNITIGSNNNEHVTITDTGIEFYSKTYNSTVRTAKIGRNVGINTLYTGFQVGQAIINPHEFNIGDCNYYQNIDGNFLTYDNHRFVLGNESDASGSNRYKLEITWPFHVQADEIWWTCMEIRIHHYPSSYGYTYDIKLKDLKNSGILAGSNTNWHHDLGDDINDTIWFFMKAVQGTTITPTSSELNTGISLDYINNGTLRITFNSTIYPDPMWVTLWIRVPLNGVYSSFIIGGDPVRKRISPKGNYPDEGTSDFSYSWGGGGFKDYNTEENKMYSSSTWLPYPFVIGAGGIGVDKTAITIDWQGRIRNNNSNACSWIDGRDQAKIQFHPTISSGMHPYISMKTYNGAWQISTYSNNALYFSYTTDANYNSGTNATTGSYIATDGTYTKQSDKKIKENIASLTYAKDLIMNLKPVEFNLKGVTNDRTHMGFIAQEVAQIGEKINKDLILYSANYKNPAKYEKEYNYEEIDDNELNWSLAYSELIAPLVQVVQEQQREIDQLKEIITKKRV